MRLTELADVLRGAGLDVYEDPGWKGRGRELTTIHGIVWHHTATGPTWLDGRVLDLLRNGRQDLPGPLAQLGLRRDGTWVVVASGRANHNGYGTWGNDSLGIEAYNSGLGEPWPSVQYESWVAGTAALCRHLDLPASKVWGHRETDPRRKIDPTGINMADARRDIQRAMNAGGSPMVPSWAKDAVEWAKAQGISNGERLNEPVTRAEALTMLHRYAEGTKNRVVPSWARAGYAAFGRFINQRNPNAPVSEARLVTLLERILQDRK